MSDCPKTFFLAERHADFPAPLRERIEDIPEIARHLLGKIGNEQQRKLTLSDMAQRRLAAHTWPGNLRELANCLDGAAVLSASAAQRSVAPAALNPVSSPNPETDIDDPNLLEKEHVITALEQAVEVKQF